MKNVVKNQATRGIFWTLVETFLTKGVALIIQIILARLLLPSDFGVIAMITVVIAVSQALVEGGFQNALIREENPSEDDFTTVFYTNLFFSIILYIILFFLSPIIAEIYTNNQLVPVIRVTALGLVFNAFTIVQRTKYTRDMNFKIQTKVAVLSSIISGIIAITIASLGWGYWSLVIQNIVLQSMTMILFILSSKWIPRGTFSKESFVKLFNFGWKLSVSSLINTIYDNVYYLIIGRNFSASAVGYYTNAQKLRDVVSQSITSSIQRVSYPMLSKLQNDNEVLKTSYKKIVKYSSLVVFAIMAGLAAIAPVLFIILFGDKWTNSIAIFQVLALAGILYPLSAINLNILQVKGRSDLFLRIELFKKVIGFLLIALGIFFKVSVIGFAWISVFISVISLGINLVYTEKLIEYSGIEQVKDIFPYAISSIIMFFCVNHFEHNILDSNILLLLSKILLGMLIYVALIWFLSKEDRTLIKKYLIEGKLTMRKENKKILVTKATLPSLDEYMSQIEDIWDTHWLTNNGMKTQLLEKELKGYLNVPNISLFTNGHLSLELLLQAMHLSGEVITTPYTFASTTHALVRNNLTPVFCDINPTDYTIDVKKIEQLITDKTTAILPVHVYGNICNVKEIEKIADAYGLKVIYDAAHAFGEVYEGKGIGNFGDASMFSFHATKVFNTIEGGGVTFSSEELGHSLAQLKNFGIKNETVVDAVGSNAKMNEFQAAMGLCNLKHIESTINNRKKIVNRYNEGLANISGIKLNVTQENLKSNYAYYPIMVDEKVYGKTRNQLIKMLNNYNIFPRKYFYPLTNSFEAYHNKFDPFDTPIALGCSKRVITLPLYPELSIDSVDNIIEIISDCREK